ncbi:hypothetical protein [Micromonospora echinospora]|uniref:hypothetical protein n=1 Tax=Micromonospora echinospora TaxID=1877 RepID=UPI003A845DD9
MRLSAWTLDRQIESTNGTIRDLARAIAAASDEAERADLVTKLDLERAKQRSQVDLRKLIDVDLHLGDEVGDGLAARVAASFSSRLGPMLARAVPAGMNPAVAAIGAPLVAGLVTLIGTAVGGAVVGGVGVGGVIGGIKLATKDPAVQAAGKQLGTDLAAVLGRSSSAFVPETLGAIDTIRDRVRDLEPELNRMFSGAARFVDPLLDGLLDAAENALPGVIDAIEAAGPVIDTVADGARDLGDALGDGLSGLADNADEGARALDVLFFVMESGVRSAFILVEAMSKLYGVAEIVGALITGDVARFWSLVTAQKGAAESSVGLSGALGEMRNSADKAEEETRKLIDALTALNDVNLSANETERNFQAAVDDARDAFDKKVKTIDLGTARGREYGAALDRIASTARASAQAIYDQTGSVSAANAKINEGREALYRQARQYGLTDARARAYADSVLSIPREWTTQIDAETAQAAQNLREVRSLISQIKSKKVVITTQHNQIVTRSEGRNVPIGAPGGRRWGGIVEHAQWGTLREAQIAAPVSPARYAWAEPATGGEAFIPRFGNPDRSLDILSQAARWYGHAVVPATTVTPQAAGGGMTLRVVVQDGAVAGLVRVEVDEAFGALADAQIYASSG